LRQTDPRQSAQGFAHLSNLYATSRCDDSVMGTEIKTSRIRRTWFDKLSLWRRAYQTKVFDGSREAVGRGPTPEASRDAALKRWVEEVTINEETPGNAPLL
jgi:hypothetical protein